MWVALPASLSRPPSSRASAPSTPMTNKHSTYKSTTKKKKITTQINQTTYFSAVWCINSYWSHILFVWCYYFLDRFKIIGDHNSNHFLLFNCGTRWLSFWLDFMSATVSLTVALFVILSPSEVISPSLKGLALSYTIQVTHKHTHLWYSYSVRFNVRESVHLCSWLCFCSVQLTGMLQYVVRLSTEVEAKFTSVERLQEYITVRGSTL